MNGMFIQSNRAKAENTFKTGPHPDYQEFNYIGLLSPKTPSLKLLPG